MALEIIEINFTKNILALSDDKIEYTPVAGKKVNIRAFICGGELSSLVSAKLVWKSGLTQEQAIWTASPGTEMPFVHIVPYAEIDGVNKLGIILENNSTLSKNMSSYAIIEVND
jgi:hypothetical protein